MPQVTCPGCGHHLNIDDQYRGQTGQCRYCKTAIHIPDLKEDEIAQEPPKRKPWKTILAAVCCLLLVSGACAGGTYMLMREKEPPVAPPPTYSVNTVVIEQTYISEMKTAIGTPMNMDNDDYEPAGTMLELKSTPEPLYTQQLEPLDPYVYITETGRCYHSRESCKGIRLARSPVETVLLSEATSRGKIACTTCFNY